MKDIGYYAGFLSPAAQQEITNATNDQLVDLLNDIASDLYSRVVPEGDDPLWMNNCLELNDFRLADHSDRDKLAVIRGLCDAIELKLMEQAK